jgi:hypothetical protein
MKLKEKENFKYKMNSKKKYANANIKRIAKRNMQMQI